MTIDTLTDEQIESALISAGYVRADFKLTPQALANSRAIEQAVLQSSESILLKLLVDIRCASGDNGLRMQPELVEHIRELKKDAELFRFIMKESWFQSAFERFDPDDKGTQAGFESECRRILREALGIDHARQAEEQK